MIYCVFKNIENDDDQIKQAVDIVDNDIVFMHFRNELLLDELKNMHIKGDISCQQYRTEKGKVRKIWLNGNSIEIINFITKRKSYEEYDKFMNKLHELKEKVYSNIYVEYQGEYFIYMEEKHD